MGPEAVGRGGTKEEEKKEKEEKEEKEEPMTEQGQEARSSTDMDTVWKVRQAPYGT